MMDLSSIRRSFGDRKLFIRNEVSCSYDAFIREVGKWSPPSTPADQALPLTMSWEPSAFVQLLGCWTNGQSVVLSTQGVGTSAFTEHHPLIILHSGGTTGEPRHVVHSMDRLFCRYHAVDRPPQPILCLYAADHIAGLDAFFQAFCRGATLVIPAGRDAASIGRCIEAERIEVLPATPTFLQFLLLAGIAEDYDLSSVKVIPHGAEPMPEPVRERIKAAFPGARLINRFGLTETGPLPVRPDPVDPDALLLVDPDYAWKLVDGEVHIKGPTRCLGTIESGPNSGSSNWYATGDLGELTERGSLRIHGRREAMINVGGEKVFPETVEAFLLAQPGILDASAYAVSSPLTGQMLVAECVLTEGVDSNQLRRDLRKAAVDRDLSLAHVPARLIRVERIQSSSVGKRLRQGKA